MKKAIKEIKMPKRGFAITGATMLEKVQVDDYINQINARAMTHTVDRSFIEQKADEAEATLIRAGVPKIRRVGCIAIYGAGGDHLPRSYEYGITTNDFVLVRATKGWRLTEFTKTTAYRSDPTTFTVKLPEIDLERIKNEAVRKATEGLRALPTKTRFKDGKLTAVYWENVDLRKSFEFECSPQGFKQAVKFLKTVQQDVEVSNLTIFVFPNRMDTSKFGWLSEFEETRLRLNKASIYTDELCKKLFNDLVADAEAKAKKAAA